MLGSPCSESATLADTNMTRKAARNRQDLFRLFDVADTSNQKHDPDQAVSSLTPRRRPTANHRTTGAVRPTSPAGHERFAIYQVP